jgi:hypothetical protein
MTLPDLTKSKSGYKFYVDKIISKGATGDERRMFLVMPHDWSRNPAQRVEADPGVYRTRTKQWRNFIAGLANDRDRVVAVDLYTAFEKIFANPGRYGLTNITTADPTCAKTTALFHDDNHFGQRGQALIKQVFEHYLTRGWDWANTLSAGSAAASRLNQDIESGIVFNMTTLTAEERQGLTAFPVGLAALPDGASDTAVDVARAGFAEAYGPDERDGGVGLNYEFGDTRLGFVVAHYDESRRVTRDASIATGTVASDSVSVYVDHELASGLVLSSRFAYSDERHQQRVHDELVGEGERAGFDGSTTEVSQRLGYPLGPRPGWSP